MAGGIDFVPGKSLKINYDFCHQEVMLTELSPGDRLFEIEDNGEECWQRMAKSPVYFDVRVPQYFDKAVLKLKYQNPAGEEFKVGPQTVKDEWLWMLSNIEQIGTEGKWQVGRAEFDLRRVYQNSPVMRWLISAPTLEENGEIIKIGEIEIEFYKGPLSVNNLWGQIKSYLRKIIR